MGISSASYNLSAYIFPKTLMELYIDADYDTNIYKSFQMKITECNNKQFIFTAVKYCAYQNTLTCNLQYEKGIICSFYFF